MAEAHPFPKSIPPGTAADRTHGGAEAGAPVQRLALPVLTAMVVGSMVGAGIFSLPRTFGTATGPVGAIVAWCIAAGGMYTLARVFQALAERKPDLNAGVYAYAKPASATIPASCPPSAIGSGAASATCRTGS